MTGCEGYRDAVSARIDGEDMGMADEALARHLADCGACRAFETAALAVTRRARLHAAEPVPDLTPAILASAPTLAAGPPTYGAPPTPAVIRFTLAMVAATQAFSALPALTGNDSGATLHVAHEQGAWGIALAAALAFAAWRPSRGAALVPLLGVFVVVMGALTTADVIGGRVAPSAELPHVIAALGLVLLWFETHPPAALVAAAPAPESRLAA